MLSMSGNGEEPRLHRKGSMRKPEETAGLQDLLIFVCKGISVYGVKLKEQGAMDKNAARFICKALLPPLPTWLGMMM